MSKAHFIFTDRTDTIRVTGSEDKAIAENKDGYVKVECHIDPKSIPISPKGVLVTIITTYTEYSSTGKMEREISKEDITDLRDTLVGAKNIA